MARFVSLVSAAARGKSARCRARARFRGVMARARCRAQIDLRIVNPETFVEKPAGEPGEIWISSASVARGYWGRPELSEATFRARVLHEPGGPPKVDKPFLRTGDEGFLEVRRARACSGRHVRSRDASRDASRRRGRTACSSSAAG